MKKNWTDKSNKFLFPYDNASVITQQVIGDDASFSTDHIDPSYFITRKIVFKYQSNELNG